MVKKMGCLSHFLCKPSSPLRPPPWSSEGSHAPCQQLLAAPSTGDQRHSADPPSRTRRASADDDGVGFSRVYFLSFACGGGGGENGGGGGSAGAAGGGRRRRELESNRNV